MGATIKPIPATALLKAKTEAVARPPMSVTTPQLAVRLQSPNSLTTNSSQQKTYGLSYHNMAASSTAAAVPLPNRATPLRDQRRFPDQAISQSLRMPPVSPAIAPPRSGRAE